MLTRVMNRLSHLEKYADRLWFFPLIALLAGLDFFILIIPTDGILVSATLMKPKKWITIGLTVALGSAMGAAAVAWLTQWHGEWMLAHIFQSAMHSSSWERTQSFLEDHGIFTLSLIALSPFPLQPAAIIAALMKMSIFFIFASSLIGRTIKYLFFAWAASHAPRLLARFTGVRKELGYLEKKKDLTEQDI